MPTTYLRKLELKNGGRLDYWVANLNVVARFIEGHQLQPVERTHLIMDDPIPVPSALQPTLGIAQEEVKAMHLLARPFPGGLRIPHLHFKGDVYPLNKAQWEQFSHIALNTAMKKLESAKSVPFEQVMEIAEAVETIG